VRCSGPADVRDFLPSTASYSPTTGGPASTPVTEPPACPMHRKLSDWVQALKALRFLLVCEM
jgi:hypothetical protein